MDIILLKDVDKVGEKHTIVNVKDGYGRNYLIPQGLAMIANKVNRDRLEEIKAKAAAEEAARLEEYRKVAEKLAEATIRIGAKAGTSGKIFGSVTSIQLSTALKEQLDLEVDRKLIDLPEEVKELGEYEAGINLHPEVEAKVKFKVEAE